ncbi:MAG: hypothetical protein ACK52K_10410 [Alphaproteobacteria bacterium]
MASLSTVVRCARCAPSTSKTSTVCRPPKWLITKSTLRPSPPRHRLMPWG